MRRKQYSRESSSSPNRKPVREKERTQRRRLKQINFSKVLTVLIATTLVFVVLYGSSVASGGSQVVVSNDSFQFRPAEDYESFVDSYISSHILSRSKLFFPVADFNEAFIRQYPEVTSIKTKVPFADRNIQVFIETPEPLFRINGASNDAQSLRYIDASGSIVGSTGSESASIPVMTVDSSSLTDIGSQLLTSNEVDILTLFVSEISPAMIDNLPQEFAVSSADLDIANGRLELGITGVDYTVRFSTYSDARNQVGALKAILTELYSGSGGESLPKEYIDVRVYEKVFIR